MISATVAIMIGSYLSTLPLVKTTLDSLTKNIGTKDVQIIIGILPEIDSVIRQFVLKFQSESHFQIHVLIKNIDWPQFINIAMDYASGSKWFFIVHDDIELLTENFIPQVDSIVQALEEPVGWISLTDKDYVNGHFAAPTRPGFHTDFFYSAAWGRRKVFQYHTLSEKWWIGDKNAQYFKNLPFDFPKAPVKCHAPFNHFILIEMAKLKKIGKCETWGPTCLLQDEDLGMRAAKLGLFNIWIPKFEYVHNRTYNREDRVDGSTRSGPGIGKIAVQVHQSWINKWGFLHDFQAQHKIKELKTRWGQSNVIWSLGKNTYDWEYVK